MSDQGRFVGSSIEELLVSLAEGVREAQLALNDAPLVSPSGRPLGSYQLPYLDFTIQVDMETRTDSGGRPVALIFMAKSQSSAVSQVKSTISGRLVATPPGDGLPVPRIRLTSGGNVGGEAAITLTVTNSAGERLADQLVELNIDDADSKEITAARGGGVIKRQPGTRLKDALLTTDAEGGAFTTLLVDPAQSGKEVVMVIASIGPFSSRVAVLLELVG